MQLLRNNKSKLSMRICNKQGRVVIIRSSIIVIIVIFYKKCYRNNVY